MQVSGLDGILLQQQGLAFAHFALNTYLIRRLSKVLT